MNKKILIFLAIFIAAVSVSGIFFGRYLGLGNKQEEKIEITPSPTPVEKATWEDPSQFTFQYPKNMQLNPHPEDNENYAHIELTNPSFPGSIILWTKDTKYQDVDSYLKGNKITNSLESSLGEFPAVKILDSADSNKFTLMTIKDGYLYEIDIDSKGDKNWTDIFNTVVDSYQFTQALGDDSTGQNTNTKPAASEESYDEEEVIE